LNFKNFKLVFTTAHQQYALEAIKNKAHDYLLKPIDIDDLKKCMESLKSSIDEKENVKPDLDPINIEIATKSGIIFLKINDLVKMVAEGSYTSFYLKNGTVHLASRNIKEYEQKLGTTTTFFRCHASFVINLKEVLEMVSNKEGIFAKMSDGSLAEISRKNKQQFLDELRKL